ncbi:MAG: hypothetical protein ACREGL_08835 [Alphaproteobacteria bacterium]
MNGKDQHEISLARPARDDEIDVRRIVWDLDYLVEVKEMLRRQRTVIQSPDVLVAAEERRAGE